MSDSDPFRCRTRACPVVGERIEFCATHLYCTSGTPAHRVVCRRLSIAGGASLGLTLAERSGNGSRRPKKLLYDAGRQPRLRVRARQPYGCTSVCSLVTPTRILQAPAVDTRSDSDRATLICVAHPAVRVDGLARLENGARSTVRQSNPESCAGRVARLDAGPRRRHCSEDGLDAVDPRHPMTVAANDEPVERHRERLRIAFGAGSEVGSGRVDDRLRGRSEIGVAAKPVKLDTLIRAGKQPADSGLRVRLAHQSERQKSTPEHAGHRALRLPAARRR